MNLRGAWGCLPRWGWWQGLDLPSCPAKTPARSLMLQRYKARFVWEHGKCQYIIETLRVRLCTGSSRRSLLAKAFGTRGAPPRKGAQSAQQFDRVLVLLIGSWCSTRTEGKWAKRPSRVRELPVVEQQGYRMYRNVCGTCPILASCPWRRWKLPLRWETYKLAPAG